MDVILRRRADRGPAFFGQAGPRGADRSGVASSIEALAALGTILTLVAAPSWSALLAVVMGPTKARRSAAIALACLGLVAPFFAPTQVLVVKGAVANVLSVGLFMLIDLARMPRLDLSPRQRILRVVGFVDPRSAKTIRPSLDVRMLARMALFGAATVAALWIAARIGPGATDMSLRIPRWVAGAVFAYCAFEVMHLSVVIPLRLIGVDGPLFHRDPILSRSVAEFWGERWNRIISGWLRRHCFMPMVKAGHPRLGVLLAFVVSALLHFYIMWPALGLVPALMFGGFFLLQPVLLVIERALQIRRRPDWVARVWTVSALLVTSPVFIEPGLRAFEPLLR